MGFFALPLMYTGKKLNLLGRNLYTFSTHPFYLSPTAFMVDPLPIQRKTHFIHLCAYYLCNTRSSIRRFFSSASAFSSSVFI